MLAQLGWHILLVDGQQFGLVEDVYPGSRWTGLSVEDARCCHVLWQIHTGDDMLFVDSNLQL